MSRFTALLVGIAMIVAISSDGQGDGADSEVRLVEAETETRTELLNDPCAGLPLACTKGLNYWPDSPELYTTVEIVDEMPEGWEDSAGYASWNSFKCEVVIHYRYRNSWRVYAHEFGHCHDMDHNMAGDVDRYGYDGIMDYDTMWRNTEYNDDLNWYNELH